MRSLLAFSFAVLLLLGGGQASAKSQTEFLSEVIQTNLGMIAIGELAGARSQNEKVRVLGRELAEHHAHANNTAMAIAISVGTPPPAEPNPDARETFGRLTGLSGDAFDRAFLAYVINAHKAMLGAYQAWTADAGPLGTFAKEMTPELEEHLQTATALASG